MISLRNPIFRLISVPFFKENHAIFRNFSLSHRRYLKEITEVQKGNTLTIEGKYVESARKPYLFENKTASCAVCNLGVELKHTDVLILSQFVRSDGCMLPRRITGLCKRQQKRMSSLVTMAQKSGLIPNLNPANSKKDPKKRFGWKKYNKYFDETTIKW